MGALEKLPSPAAAQPFPRRTARSVPRLLRLRLHKAGVNRRGTGALRGSRPGAVGRSPWGRGGDWRAAAARGVRVASLGLQARTPRRRGPRPAPAAGAEDVQNPGPCRPRAHHLPLTEGPDREAGRGASRQSLPRCPPPTPSPLSSSSPPLWSWGPLGSAGQ